MGISTGILIQTKLWASEFSILVQLPGWLMMPADEFKLVFKIYSILGTEAIKK